MIIIRYRGGLGNQMFQYAFQLNIERRYPGAHVVADISHYLVNYEHNGFELESLFGIKFESIPNEELKKYSPYYIPSSKFLKYPKFIKKYIQTHYQYAYYDRRSFPDKASFSYYKQKSHNSYEPEVYDAIEHSLEEDEVLYLDGLWQDYRYFEEYTEDLRHIFTLVLSENNDVKMLDYICSRDFHSVGIHIRRGDFTNSKFDICKEEYYKKSINSLREGDYRFFFFTDDAKYVEDNYDWVSDKIICSHDISCSYVDMKLMSACENLIISNSTFAFWAAFLSERTTKVIAPKYSVIKGDIRYELNVPNSWESVD